jgi:uncharacterized membrane protein
MSLISNRKKLIFDSLLTGLIILSFFLIFKYSLLLPTLDARIFESFIQVIGILLGFTVVGIFYYLVKIDDQKNHLINSLLTNLSRIKTVTSREDEQVKKFLEALDKVDDANKFYRGEQIRQIISQILQIKRENASVLKGSDAIIKDIVSSIIITSHFFSVIWKDFQNLTNTIFVKIINIDTFLLGK